jgi:hypothetical protein
VPQEDLITPGPSAPASVSGASRHVVWLLVSFALLSVFPYYGRINNPNENARVWMVKAIVDHHELTINRVSQEWGYVNDKAIMNGRLYSSKAPGTSFVGVPIYFVQRQLARAWGMGAVSQRSMILALRLFGVALPLCVFLFFFARHVERLTGSGAARDLLVAGLGLGTMLYPYGVIFVGHGVAAALAFSGFMLLSDPRETRPGTDEMSGRLMWAGMLVGLSVMFEYQAMFAAVIIAGYAVARHRWGARYFLLGALPPAALLGLYHTVLFGKPWDFPLGHLENPEWARLHNQVRFFGLRAPDLFAVGAILFSVNYGIFVFSPFLIVGLVGAFAVLATRDYLEAAVILAISAVMVFVLAGVPTWHPGWCVGPRYIAVVEPFLAVGVAYAWRHTRRVFAISVIIAGLVIPAVFLNVISGAIYPHYPEVYDNPVFDLTLPLVEAGFVPYSLGWWLGLRGSWSLMPLVLAVGTALAVAITGGHRQSRRWALHASLAVILAGVFLLPLCRYGQAPRAEEARSTAFIRATWEPLPVVPPVAPPVVPPVRAPVVPPVRPSVVAPARPPVAGGALTPASAHKERKATIPAKPPAR